MKAAVKIVREDARTQTDDAETAMPWIQLALGDFLRAQSGQAVQFSWRKLHHFMRAHPERYPPINDAGFEDGGIYGKCLKRLADEGLITRVTPIEQSRGAGTAYTICERVRPFMDCGKGKLLSIPLENIEPPRHMLRRTLGDLSQLMVSIRTNGVLVPPTVRPVGNDKFEVVDGHRRIQACLNLGNVKEITCFVRELDDTAAVLVGLAQNIDRQSMSPLEVAETIFFLMKRGLSIEFIAKELGKTTRFLRSCLVILSLPENVRMSIHRGELSTTKALEIERDIRLGRLTQEKAERLLGIAFEKNLTKEELRDTLRILRANPEESEEQAVESVLQRRKDLSLGYHPERQVFIVANKKSSFQFECLKCHQQYEIDWKEGYIQTRQSTLSEFPTQGSTVSFNEVVN